MPLASVPPTAASSSSRPELHPAPRRAASLPPFPLQACAPPLALPGPPPLEEADPAARRGASRWLTVVWTAESDPERRAGWGKGSAGVRVLLRAIAVAARLGTTMAPAFGVRSLSLMTGLHPSTVALNLALLRQEDDPLLVRTVVGRGKYGDRYRLRTPQAYKHHLGAWAWRSTHVETVHPAVSYLGASAALLYETLSATDVGSSQLARQALLSRSTTTKALRTLAAAGLAVRGPAGWKRSTCSLDEAAVRLGAHRHRAEQLAAIHAQRRDWQALLQAARPPIESAPPVMVRPRSERPGPPHSRPPGVRPAPARTTVLTGSGEPSWGG
ncbi:hypothetical protein GCM10014719_47920 [Planomonospora parontospora subsp. antibiotica]|nr:hypothetical protein GCM10014719_47920 [Planomonospora parontospora subsp. antibiotica]GII17921.1 hypothetical protein Ppa05_46470 [Planomonospora parontospora subsp. antibiotica]